MSARSWLLPVAVAVLVAVALPSCKGCRTKKSTAVPKKASLTARTPVPPVQAHLLVLAGDRTLDTWLKLDPAKRPTTLTRVGPGERVTFALVLTEYRPVDIRRIDLKGQIRVVAPDGKVVLDRPDAGRGSMATLKAPKVVVLVPSPDLVFTNQDQPGVYTASAVVDDALVRERRYLSTSFELVFSR